MELVPGFMVLLQGLSATMTAPSFASLTTIMSGWVFAGRRTVTRMILAAGPGANKYYSSYHRLFIAARWSLDAVAAEALRGGRGQEAFYSTRYDATAEQVIAWYAMRWSVEVTFHDSKQHLGFEEPPSWSRRAVERTAPIAMLLYSLTVLWFAREGHRNWHPLDCPWYVSKADPSFADMLTTLRQLSVKQQVLSLALQGPGSRKLQQLLHNAVAMAA